LTLRAGDADSSLITATNIEDYILDSTEVYARCAALFKFAGGESGTAPGEPTRDQIRSALNQTGFWFEEFENLHKRVDAHYDT
jgi:hypothetical protein